MTRNQKTALIVAGIVVILIVASPKTAEKIALNIPGVKQLYRASVAKKVVDQWGALVTQISFPYQEAVPPEYVLAIICQESGGDPNAQNPSDPSRGLMALTPGALSDVNRYLGTSYTFDQLYDPTINVTCGCEYIYRRYMRWKDYRTALAAYNAGDGNTTAGASYADSVMQYLQAVLDYSKQIS